MTVMLVCISYLFFFRKASRSGWETLDKASLTLRFGLLFTF